MKNNLLTRFLSKTENTKKFNLQSRVRSIIYGMESIQINKPSVVWGNLDPVTMRLIGNYENAIEKDMLNEEFKIIQEDTCCNILVLERNHFTKRGSRDNEFQLIKSP